MRIQPGCISCNSTVCPYCFYFVSTFFWSVELIPYTILVNILAQSSSIPLMALYGHIVLAFVGLEQPAITQSRNKMCGGMLHLTTNERSVFFPFDVAINHCSSISHNHCINLLSKSLTICTLILHASLSTTDAQCTLLSNCISPGKRHVVPHKVSAGIGLPMRFAKSKVPCMAMDETAQLLNA